MTLLKGTDVEELEKWQTQEPISFRFASPSFFVYYYSRCLLYSLGRCLVQPTPDERSGEGEGQEESWGCVCECVYEGGGGWCTLQYPSFSVTIHIWNPPRPVPSRPLPLLSSCPLPRGGCERVIGSAGFSSSPLRPPPLLALLRFDGLGLDGASPYGLARGEGGLVGLGAVQDPP